MTMRQTFSQRVFPTTFEFTSRLRELTERGTGTILEIVFAGLSRFEDEILSVAVPSRDNPDLERDLSDLLFPCIQRAMPREVPYFLHPERKERESMKGRGQPPEPDFSFVFYCNQRVTFPVDAKVLAGDGAAHLDDYIDTIMNRFLDCVYAPFSVEGAMLAFLLKGSETALFESIASRLGHRLSSRGCLRGRAHRVSFHTRTHARCRYRRFRCHHLVLLATPAPPRNAIKR